MNECWENPNHECPPPGKNLAEQDSSGGRLARSGERRLVQIVQWQPQECGVQPQPPEVPADSADALLAAELPLPVCAANVENWIVELLLPHLGHSAFPLLAVTIFS